MSIKGVGVDIVDVARFEQQVAKTAGLAERLFVDSEIADAHDKSSSLAGKFAAKEAFIKAVGSGLGMNWHDVVVAKDPAGKPFFELTGATANIVREAGIVRLHLSIAHDGGMAIAYVIAEGETDMEGGANA